MVFVFHRLDDALSLLLGEFSWGSTTFPLPVRLTLIHTVDNSINLIILDVQRLKKVNGVGFSLFDIFSVKIAGYWTAGFMFDTLHDRVYDCG